MRMLFLEMVISITHAFFWSVVCFALLKNFDLFFFFFFQLGYSLPIHFVVRSVLTDLKAAAGPTERSREINLSLF